MEQMQTNACRFAQVIMTYGIAHNDAKRLTKAHFVKYNIPVVYVSPSEQIWCNKPQHFVPTEQQQAAINKLLGTV